MLSWRAIEAKRMAGTGDECSHVNFAHLDAELEIEPTSELFTVLFERPKIILASREGAALSDSVVEVHGNEISYADKGRGPSTALDTAVQPINGSVGAGSRGDLFCQRFRAGCKSCGSEILTGSTVGSAPAILNLDDAASAGSRVALGRIGI